MALNGQDVEPPNPFYRLSTWREIYSNKVEPIKGSNFWGKSSCPTTLLPPYHHTQVGRPRKKRKKPKY